MPFTATAYVTAFYDIVGYWRGRLPDPAIDPGGLHRLILPRVGTFPVGLTTSPVPTCFVAPTGDVSMAFRLNILDVGSLDFAAGQTTGTFTFPAAVYFKRGDLWHVRPPTPWDPTFSGPSWTISGSLAQ